MQIPRPIARIALASTAVVALALTSASAATAAPIEVNVCADSNVFVPVGTDFILDFSACEADLTSGPDLDLYDADSTYSAGGSLTLVDGKTPLTFTQTMNNVYAYTLAGDGSGTGPWGSNQFNLFIFACGTDAATFTEPIGPEYVTYSRDMPTVTLCPDATSAVPLWHQAVTRTSHDAACPQDYTGSWAQWPNNGLGGWVCNKTIPVYGS